METNLKKQIDSEIRNNLTNGICASGGNISHIENLLKKKYVSKTEVRKTLKMLSENLKMIQDSKDEVLSILKATTLDYDSNFK